MPKAQRKQKKSFQAEIRELLDYAAYTKDIYRVFMDFVEMSAISIANAIPFAPCRDARERMYMDIIGGYDKERKFIFPKMLNLLVREMESKALGDGPEDVLGPLYHSLGLHSRDAGQFFTPVHVADLMAALNMDRIGEQGYLHVYEPTCGSGVMPCAMAKNMKIHDLNYCDKMVVTATDIDIKCVYMCYIQLALYGIPARVLHANGLTGERWSEWSTPLYVMNGWDFRLKSKVSN